MKAVSQSVS